MDKSGIMALRKFALILLFPSLLLTCGERSVVFTFDNSSSQLQFAVSEIKDALQATKLSRYSSIIFEKVEVLDQEGGYTIQVRKDKVFVSGQDDNELMYGGLEVAEQISLLEEVSVTKHIPYLKKRGIKMNIPLDARTPSYDDTGDAAQENIIHMWDWSFWVEYLDALAINRYNVLTLWNPHPFPSMIKLDKYPDVALDDICKTTLEPIGVENEWAEPQMVSTNVLENLQVIKEMTIDEKIDFWQKVMERAEDRGIEIYFFTWNLCANAAANAVSANYRTYKQPLWDEVPGKYGITNQMDNPINVEYFQESVAAFLRTYPLVKGIGITAGEHMLDQAGEYTREGWIWEAYGLPILEVQNEDPSREIRFIHRVWNTDLDKVMSYWKDYPGKFDASFKYARARLYSTPTPDFASNHISTMEKYGVKSWWNLRNDDIFVHRWGDPEYVRDFINHFDLSSTIGFYMGSDGYVWGRDFNSKDPKLANKLEMNKHWYKFMLWGRLAYNNKLEPDFFIRKIKSHYPEVDAPLLYDAWSTASKIIPAVNRFHWNNWDYQWSVEACIDARIGFHDIDRFITNGTLPESSLIRPLDYAKMLQSGTIEDVVSPLDVVAEIRELALQTQDLVGDLRGATDSSDQEVLLDDLESMSHLGQYYASKIEAATELALYGEDNNSIHKDKAVNLLESCVQYWKNYSSLLDKNYRSQMLARTKYFDGNVILEQVKDDVRRAENYSPH